MFPDLEELQPNRIRNKLHEGYSPAQIAVWFTSDTIAHVLSTYTEEPLDVLLRVLQRRLILKIEEKSKLLPFIFDNHKDQAIDMLCMYLCGKSDEDIEQFQIMLQTRMPALAEYLNAALRKCEEASRQEYTHRESDTSTSYKEVTIKVEVPQSQEDIVLQTIRNYLNSFANTVMRSDQVPVTVRRGSIILVFNVLDMWDVETIKFSIASKLFARRFIYWLKDVGLSLSMKAQKRVNVKFLQTIDKEDTLKTGKDASADVEPTQESEMKSMEKSEMMMEMDCASPSGREMDPVQIIAFDNDGCIKVNIQKIKDHLYCCRGNLIKIVSVCGPFRSGKSTLLNTWSGKPGAFKVGHTTEAETEGVWMHVKDTGQKVILLDVEGWNNSKSKHQDVWLPIIMMMISGEVVINTKFSVDETCLKKVSSLLWLAVHMAKKAQPKDWKVPRIRILIRDFQLELGDKSPDDYLSEQLESAEVNHRVINGMFWKKKRCNVLPMPHIKPEKLGTREGAEVIQPTVDFTEEACEILSDIIQNYSSNSMDASEWIDTVISVTRAVEEMRKYPTTRKRFALTLSVGDVIDIVKAHMAEEMTTFNIVTRHSSDLGKEPFSKDMFKSCLQKAIDNAHKTFKAKDQNNEIPKFAKRCKEVFDQHVLGHLRTCYESLCQHQADLSPFKTDLQHAKMNFVFEWAENWQYFFLKQLLNLVEKVLADKKWMEVQVKEEIEEYLKRMKKSQKHKGIKAQIKRHCYPRRRSLSEKYQQSLEIFLQDLKDDEQFDEKEYEDILTLYSTWSDQRYNTIHRLKQVAQNLDDLKVGTKVTKKVSGGLGVAAGVLAIISIPLPIVLPAAITVGGVSAATAIASVTATHHIRKTSKKNFKEICNSDGESSEALQKCLNNLHRRITANINSGAERHDVSDVGAVMGAVSATSGTVLAATNIGQGAMGAVDDSSEALAAAARAVGPAVAGVVIGLDVALMGVTIYDMVENKSKNAQAKIEECIEDLEMEMELRAQQIIPIKYLLVKQYLQK